VAAFSRAGGVPFLAAVATTELAACERSEEEQSWLELVEPPLRMLDTCAQEDVARALPLPSDDAPFLALPTLLLHSRIAPFGTRDAAAALLARQLCWAKESGGSDSERFRASLAACAAEGTPEDVTRLLRDIPADCTAGCAGATVWALFAQTPEAWGGGAAALAARAEACDAAGALATARVACGRAHAARGQAIVEAHAKELFIVEVLLRQLLDSAREAAAEAAAAALLAEEAAIAAAAATKAQRKQEAKARRAAAAQAAAAQAAAAAEQAAAEEAAATAARNAAARAAAQAAAVADAAAHVARRDAAAAAAAAEQQRQRQQRARQPPPMPPPPPQPLAPQSSTPAEEGRASDALLAELFPWMRMHDEPHPPAPPPALPAAAGAAGGADEDVDGDDGCCAICMDAPRTAALAPCGHALLCDACAARVLATAAPLCPVCRVVATGVRAAA
jgi:SWI/SNF-related matrix-associated actin-dependent regulator 1 of chromatin subfamily A